MGTPTSSPSRWHGRAKVSSEWNNTSTTAPNILVVKTVLRGVTRRPSNFPVQYTDCIRSSDFAQLELSEREAWKYAPRLRFAWCTQEFEGEERAVCGRFDIFSFCFVAPMLLLFVVFCLLSVWHWIFVKFSFLRKGDVLWWGVCVCVELFLFSCE